jgi:hypothetical protein
LGTSSTIKINESIFDGTIGSTAPLKAKQQQALPIADRLHKQKYKITTIITQYINFITSIILCC